MLDQFLEEHAKVKTKPATYAEYRRLLDRHVRPAVGKLKAEDLGYDDVEKLHVKMQDTPRQGNLVIAILSKACGWAGRNKHRKGLPNPVHGIERYKELSRTVSLSDADIAALGKALKAKEDGGETPQVFVDAARMVMLSQLRLSEVLSLRPEHIDTENSQLNVGIVKKGNVFIRLELRSWRTLLSSLETRKANGSFQAQNIQRNICQGALCNNFGPKFAKKRDCLTSGCTTYGMSQGVLPGRWAQAPCWLRTSWHIAASQCLSVMCMANRLQSDNWQIALKAGFRLRLKANLAT